MFHFGVTPPLGLVSSNLLLVDKNQEREFLVTQAKMDQNKKKKGGPGGGKKIKQCN
jgi:hypothetical protein